MCVIPYALIDKYNEFTQLYKYLYVGYVNNEEKENIHYPKVYINDILYLDKNDYLYLNYAYMIRDNKKEIDYNLNDNKNHYLMETDEVNKHSSAEDIKNTITISNLCNVNFTKHNDLLPIFDNNINSSEYLINLCKAGLKKRLANKVTKEYSDRLNYELSIINKMGFNDYFLVVWDFIKYAKKNSILVGPGRGSAAGSMVSYTLGITDIDPIKYNLFFERFLNPERITMPDIDIDFDAYKRSDVIEYVANKYGSKKVAQIITFGTMGSKQVIRDVDVWIYQLI